MDKKNDRPIIVKKIKKSAHGFHGGVWKIAYADFVTAMMAFFLLMWLLNSVEKNKLRGIEKYFKTPINRSAKGGQGAGEQIFVAGKGGGDTATTKLGAAQMTNKPQPEKSNKPAPPTPDSKTEASGDEQLDAMKQLKAQLESQIESNPSLKDNKNQIKIDITKEGLRVQIVDAKNRPMFDSSTDNLAPYTKQILLEIGKVLNKVPDKISITGHTDAKPYEDDSKQFSNWELSTQRANATRRELIAGGMTEDKVIRIVGLASVNLLDPVDPTNPINRRISIIVLNKKTEKEIAEFGY